ncbi:hypothetical protein [Glaciecola sp. 1036]|uniref:hypothetical protein n=1 Tax=Alteromonadaceae TaxID=72275 RepID=UPI003D001F5D
MNRFPAFASFFIMIYSVTSFAGVINVQSVVGLDGVNEQTNFSVDDMNELEYTARYDCPGLPECFGTTESLGPQFIDLYAYGNLASGTLRSRLTGSPASIAVLEVSFGGSITYEGSALPDVPEVPIVIYYSFLVEGSYSLPIPPEPNEDDYVADDNYAAVIARVYELETENLIDSQNIIDSTLYESITDQGFLEINGTILLNPGERLELNSGYQIIGNGDILSTGYDVDFGNSAFLNLTVSQIEGLTFEEGFLADATTLINQPPVSASTPSTIFLLVAGLFFVCNSRRFF